MPDALKPCPAGVLLLLLAACSARPAVAPDAGPADAGPTDAGPVDAGPVDAGAVDAGPFRWTAAAPCPLPRFEAMGAVVGGRLLVLGGFTSSSLAVTKRVDAYDPATDTWEQLADLPGAETHAGAATDGEALWLVGGFRGWPATTTAETWRRDPASGAWAPGPVLPQPRAALALALVGRSLHAVGGLAADGQTDTGEHEALDLDSPSAGWAAAPALPNPRNHLGGAAAGGLLLAVGGRHGWDEAGGNQASLSRFDPDAGAWSSGADLPLGRSEIAAATFASGAGMLVVGGSQNGVHPVDAVSLYDPARDAWVELPPLPAPRKGAVAARIGNRLVVTTGSPTSTDPDGATWVGCCLE